MKLCIVDVLLWTGVRDYSEVLQDYFYNSKLPLNIIFIMVLELHFTGYSPSYLLGFVVLGFETARM